MKATMKIVLLTIVLTVGYMTMPAHGQPAPGGAGGGFGAGAAGGFGGGAGGAGGAGFGGGAGGGGRGGGQDPATMRQTMFDYIKAQLAVADDEFAAIQPKIEQVLADEQAITLGVTGPNGLTRGGGRRGGQNGANALPANANAANGLNPNGGPGGGRGGRGNRTALINSMFTGEGALVLADVQQSLTDLQTVLQQDDATADLLKSRLDALHASRVRAREALTNAEADLKSVLTQRQEAILVNIGVLED